MLFILLLVQLDEALRGTALNELLCSVLKFTNLLHKFEGRSQHSGLVASKGPDNQLIVVRDLQLH